MSCANLKQTFSVSKETVSENHKNACVNFCIERYLIEHVVPKKIDAPRRGPIICVFTCHGLIGKYIYYKLQK